MQNLTELENKVSGLSNKEYAEFREWFWQHENERWDEQIEKDIAESKLDNLANEAIEAYKKGNFNKL